MYMGGAGTVKYADPHSDWDPRGRGWAQPQADQKFRGMASAGNHHACISKRRATRS